MIECSCGREISQGRYDLGYRVCLKCGDKEAKEVSKAYCIAPMHKSNYILVTNKADLVGLNNKGGLIK